MLKIDSLLRQPLYTVAATRRIEQLAQAGLAPHALMQRAGLAVARLALAIAPHSQRIWLACGPGNNGGDGLEAALHLQRWGKHAIVTWLGNPGAAPPDARAAHQRALAGGVTFSPVVPPDWDLCVDALLGIGGQSRAPDGRMADWIQRLNAGSAPVLAVDLPSGLNADTGRAALPGVRAQHTLSLLTLKPGLFTADGRDAAGTVWLDDLQSPADKPGDPATEISPVAWLAGATAPASRRHASHKGSYGDVLVVGGAPGMTGAALLAASAALHGGAGRVFVGLLDAAALSVDIQQPELMFRPLASLDFKAMTVVCGCGGGAAVREPLAKIISTAARLVIDADALNAIAADTQLQTLLSQRSKQLAPPVLTPHPLEAARLLGISVADVQNDRLAAAGQLAQRFGCTVILKGSGSIIAAPGQTPVINPTGNARLATAGTGDVLAGRVGAGLAAGLPGFQTAYEAVYQHGLLADQWPQGQPLTASQLSRICY